jgi:hypothetical protein
MEIKGDVKRDQVGKLFREVINEKEGDGTEDEGRRSCQPR